METNSFTPSPNVAGLFAPLVGTAPETWPWALPHLWAVNVAPSVGNLVVRASALPTGEYVSQVVVSAGKAILEVVGFWRDQYRVVYTKTFDQADAAKRAARDDFVQLPIRYLMECGRIVEENARVNISGNWPEEWSIKRVQDLGVLCAYLYEEMIDHEQEMGAKRFRSLLYLASPPTEQIIVYLKALDFADTYFGKTWSLKAQKALRTGIATARAWLG